MQKYRGKSVFAGIAMGPVTLLKKPGPKISCQQIEDPDQEIDRLEVAAAIAREQLQKLYERALGEVGEKLAAIFEAHETLLGDEELFSAIANRIRSDMVNAEYAVNLIGEQYASLFENMNNEYMRARAADIRDITERLIRCLSGENEKEETIVSPSILVAEYLTPSEILHLNREQIIAIVTTKGSVNSHAAILARTMNVPALIGVAVSPEEIEDGMMAIVDGFASVMILNPSREICREAGIRIQKQEQNARLLQQYKGKETRTSDGRTIRICANIGSVEEAGYAADYDAEGIGLFRSEFLYLGHKDYPAEEEQYQAYLQTLSIMNGRKVIIRTMDLGSDKTEAYLPLEAEENPALGLRAIRFCLKHPDIFSTQLRALLRAAAHGNLAIMYPMITSVWEIEQIQELLEKEYLKLQEEHIPCRIPEQGIMIETPAAALISDELARKVDFFSIGTNDLTQYTLALDRQNDYLEAFHQPHHPAILQLIRMTVENAHKYGKWAGICGELGADPTLTEWFLQIGVDELSVPPAMVLRLRKQICEL